MLIVILLFRMPSTSILLPGQVFPTFLAFIIVVFLHVRVKLLNIFLRSRIIYKLSTLKLITLVESLHVFFKKCQIAFTKCTNLPVHNFHPIQNQWAGLGRTRARGIYYLFLIWLPENQNHLWELFKIINS